MEILKIESKIRMFANTSPFVWKLRMSVLKVIFVKYKELFLTHLAAHCIEI